MSTINAPESANAPASVASNSASGAASFIPTGIGASGSSIAAASTPVIPTNPLEIITVVNAAHYNPTPTNVYVADQAGRQMEERISTYERELRQVGRDAL